MINYTNEYKLENYQKIKPLNTNNNLWLVKDSVTEKQFVMRRLPIESQKVYQTLAKIHHPHIVEIIDVFSYNSFLYVIEEYLDYELLSQKAAGKKLPRRRVLAIGIQILQALSTLHEHNIIHRDIKPENIMINSHRDIKLIDFDIARQFSANKSGDTSVKGSKDYAPPEQFGFSQSDCRTDIYSLGVTLNELATGNLPEKELCTGQLGVIIKRCIEFDPKRRYQTANQILKHIHKRKTFFFASLSVLLVLILAATFLSVKKFHQTQTYPDEALFETQEYQDRIVYVREPEAYPALLMTEDREYKFRTDLKENQITTISAEKTEEQLKLNLTLPDGSEADFTFKDVCSDIYKQLGYSINVDFEKTSPEYEILLDDFNQDGIWDLLITLAWRRCVTTPDPSNRYYLTEYSTVWVVSPDNQNHFTCSEPLYFEGCRPSLENDTILYDTMSSIWYSYDAGSNTWYYY